MNAGYDVTDYGRAIAQLDWHQRPLFDVEARAFAEWAEKRFDRCFEIGISYGRTALALAERGLRVTGCDISAELVTATEQNADRLGLEVRAFCADFLRWRSTETFDLVVCVANTLFMFASMRAQVECLERARRMLAGPESTLVIQCTHDPAYADQLGEPRENSSEWTTESGVVVVPARYVRQDPAAVEGMIRAAGLEVTERRVGGFASQSVPLTSTLYTWMCARHSVGVGAQVV